MNSFLRSFANDYGMVLVLVLLGLVFSGLTLEEQPATDAAARLGDGRERRAKLLRLAADHARRREARRGEFAVERVGQQPVLGRRP
ncbi:MAG: hypothetical protein ACKOTB_13275, partial [Planctomycetia bacterium]